MNITVGWQSDNLMSHCEDQSEKNVIQNEKTDSQLIALILAGGEAEFEKLFDRYKFYVARVANRILRRPEEIEEAVQISFTKIYLELKTFQVRHDFSFVGWIGRITTNVCLDMLRRQKRKPEELICELSGEEIDFLLMDKPSDFKSIENLIIEQDLTEKLMSSLEPEDKAVIRMLYQEEMSVREISEITGWSSSKIKIRAYRARKALRKIIIKFV